MLDPKLTFSVSVDMEHWAKPFSIVQFFDAIEQVVSKHPTYRLKFNQQEVQLLSDFFGIYIDIKDHKQALMISLKLTDYPSEILFFRPTLCSLLLFEETLLSPSSNSHQPLRQPASSTLSTSFSS